MNEKLDLEIQYTVDDYVRGIMFIQNRQFIVKYGFIILPSILMIFILFTLLSNPDSINQISLKYALITFALILAICVFPLLLRACLKSLRQIW